MAFGLKHEKLPHGDLELKCPKQWCSEGKSFERRGSLCAQDLKGGHQPCGVGARAGGARVREGCMDLLSMDAERKKDPSQRTGKLCERCKEGVMLFEL